MQGKTWMWFVAGPWWLKNVRKNMFEKTNTNWIEGFQYKNLNKSKELQIGLVHKYIKRWSAAATCDLCILLDQHEGKSDRSMTYYCNS